MSELTRRDVIRREIRAEWGLAEGELSTEAAKLLAERIDRALPMYSPIERLGKLEKAAQKVCRWHYQHSMIEALDDLVALRAAMVGRDG